MIMDASGCENVKVVASYTLNQPNFVRIYQSCKLTCACPEIAI
jgi:hypothetical protein